MHLVSVILNIPRSRNTSSTEKVSTCFVGALNPGSSVLGLAQAVSILVKMSDSVPFPLEILDYVHDFPNDLEDPHREIAGSFFLENLTHTILLSRYNCAGLVPLE